jgi:diacylglycerol kinase
MGGSISHPSCHGPCADHWIVNSAVEALCDVVKGRHSERIKTVKYIAAAALGISIVVWGVVCTVELNEMELALALS